MNNIIIIGCGGHAKSCIEVLSKKKDYKIIGLICNQTKGKKINNIKILGKDENLKEIKSKKCKKAIIGIGQIKNYKIRKKMFNLLKKYKFELPSIIADSAYFSKSSKISEGSIVMHMCFVNSNVKIGKNSIINSRAIIEHDVTIGSNCHISTGVIINGGSTIKDGTFIGSGSVVNENITIGKDCIVSSNSKVQKNLKNNTLLK